MDEPSKLKAIQRGLQLLRRWQKGSLSEALLIEMHRVVDFSEFLFVLSLKRRVGLP